MPTLLVLDVSLSMSRTLTVPDGAAEEPVSCRQLAIDGIHTLLDYVAQHCQLEYAAVVAYSSMYESLGAFTRDFGLLKSRVASLGEYDKTCIESAMTAINTLIKDEWGTSTACQVVLMTDGSLGVGSSSLAGILRGEADTAPLSVPLPFPCRLDVVLLADRAHLQRYAVPTIYKQLIQLAGAEGDVHVPDGTLTPASAEAMFRQLAEKNYAPFVGTLSLGGFSTQVILCPPPQTYSRTRDFDIVRRSVSSELKVHGFISTAEVASPAAFSRHLILPTLTQNGDDGVKSLVDGDMDGTSPNFCVLLHGGLKKENSAALVNVGDDWYGVIYSWSDSKKKANLMLSLFEPGVDVLPWLGDLSRLAPVAGEETPSGFPVRCPRKRSYQQACISWVKQTGLHSDIQKVLRHARKLPEKTASFYKELNRVRCAALALGFYAVLDSLSLVLDRECTQLPGNAHPDCALQLSHAAAALQLPEHRRPENPVQPLWTRYHTDT